MASSASSSDPRTAPRERLAFLLGSGDPGILLEALENPALDEAMLCRLLDRKDLSGELLQRVSKNSEWMQSYPVKLRLARHPNSPRLVALAAVRQLFLFDLVKVSLLPFALAEVRRVAEDLILNRLAQLPLGQKITLAKQGPARIVGALLGEGLPTILGPALENPYLTEKQITRALARHETPARVVEAISRHPKWSSKPHVRIALVRNRHTPLARVMAFVPEIPLHDLRELYQLADLRPDLRNYLGQEVLRRSSAGRKRSE
jgi:hypothetical protein